MVYYYRGDYWVRVRATVGATEFTRDDGSGQAVVFHSTDFIVDAADLVINEARITPQRGDKIVRGTLEDGTVHELMNDPGTQSWRYADAYRRTFRVHTKQTGTT
jgi:hypothetical protein